jgi:predicted RNA-binding Zn ribbon-like protein
VHDNHYTARALLFAVDLLNAPPQDVDELRDRCTRRDLLSDFVVRPDDLVRTLELLEAFATIVDAPSPRARAEVLNVHLARYLHHPRLTDHDGSWHLHHRSPGAPLSAVLATMVFGRTALHLAEHGMGRLGRCRLEECDRAYVDLSRSGRQRYCSPGCGNRDAVRRHRARAARP